MNQFVEYLKFALPNCWWTMEAKEIHSGVVYIAGIDDVYDVRDYFKGIENDPFMQMMVAIDNYYDVAAPLSCPLGKSKYPYCQRCMGIQTARVGAIRESDDGFEARIAYLCKINIGGKNYQYVFVGKELHRFVEKLEKYFIGRYEKQKTIADLLGKILPQPIAEEMTEYV